MRRFRLLFVMVALFASSMMYAQVSFSCNYRQTCQVGEDLEVDEDLCSGYEDNSLFVINEQETMFTHTTSTIKSAYYINVSSYDEENETWTFQVVSDVGNKYTYIFKPDEKEIVAIPEDLSFFIIFKVKAIF